MLNSIADVCSAHLFWMRTLSLTFLLPPYLHSKSQHPSLYINVVKLITCMSFSIVIIKPSVGLSKD